MPPLLVALTAAPSPPGAIIAMAASIAIAAVLIRGQRRPIAADAPVIGAYMARHALIPDLVLVSTAERTRQTWERVATALTTPPRVAYEERLYNAGAEAIIALVKGTAAMVRTLLVVGHNPGLHEAARRLIASGDVETRERLNEGLPTSGLAVIDFAGKDWRKLHPRGGRLERFVSPRSLAEADRV